METTGCPSKLCCQSGKLTGMDDDLDHTLGTVGPRLRALRRQRETTLADLSAETGISVSTLSRLESGERRPTPRTPAPPGQGVQRHARRARQCSTHRRPTHPSAPGQASRHDNAAPDPPGRWHPGVQAGDPGRQAQTRTRPPDPRGLRMGVRPQRTAATRPRRARPGALPDEAAEFDTRTPHWFGAANDDAVEFLSLFGRQGERAHLRARPESRSSSTPD